MFYTELGPLSLSTFMYFIQEKLVAFVEWWRLIDPRSADCTLYVFSVGMERDYKINVDQYWRKVVLEGRAMRIYFLSDSIRCR